MSGYSQVERQTISSVTLWHYGDIWIHPRHEAELERLDSVQRQALIFLSMAGIFANLKEGAVDIEDVVDAILKSLDK